MGNTSTKVVSGYSNPPVAPGSISILSKDFVAGILIGSLATTIIHQVSLKFFQLTKGDNDGSFEFISNDPSHCFFLTGKPFSSQSDGGENDVVSLRLGVPNQKEENGILGFVNKMGIKTIHLTVSHLDLSAKESLKDQISKLGNLEVSKLTIDQIPLEDTISLDVTPFNNWRSLNELKLIALPSTGKIDALSQNSQLLSELDRLRLKKLTLENFPLGSIGSKEEGLSVLRDLEELHIILPKKEESAPSKWIPTFRRDPLSSVDLSVAGLRPKVKVFFTPFPDNRFLSQFKEAVDSARAKDSKRNREEIGPSLYNGSEVVGYPYLTS